MRLVFLGLLLLLPGIVAACGGPCSDATRVGATCGRDVRNLRPFQRAIGIEEARDKAKKIAAKPKKEWQSLAGDPIKVIWAPAIRCTSPIITTARMPGSLRGIPSPSAKLKIGHSLLPRQSFG